jgi:hypothetical protein
MINLDGFDATEYAVVRRILDREGYIRRSRPPIKMDGDTPEFFSGMAAYVWRMVVFTISKTPKHQCLPVMALDYLPGRSEDVRQFCQKAADALVDKIVKQIPVSQWHGIARWHGLL